MCTRADANSSDCTPLPSPFSADHAICLTLVLFNVICLTKGRFGRLQHLPEQLMLLVCRNFEIWASHAESIETHHSLYGLASPPRDLCSVSSHLLQLFAWTGEKQSNFPQLQILPNSLRNSLIPPEHKLLLLSWKFPLHYI